MHKALLGFITALALMFAGTIALAATIDLNTATQAQLEQLKGLGPVKAQAIIDERAKNGPFRSMEDVQKRTNGIGAKTLEEMKASGAMVGGSAAAATKAVKPPDKSEPKKEEKKQ